MYSELINSELIINIASKKCRAFLQNGFYITNAPNATLHKHNFAEIHVTANGSAVFNVGEHSYTLNSGNMMLIPRGTFHCCIDEEKDTLHTAFQIDFDMNEFTICDIGNDTVRRFLQEIQECRVSCDYTKIAAYIALFCSHFRFPEKLSAQPVTDYGFLINEFFSMHYNEDLHLRDLADALHLSERQTERLVILHTGHTFREELNGIRMNIAKKLLQANEMSLKEISEYVGYSSYTGFWKAMKKYDLDVNNIPKSTEI